MKEHQNEDRSSLKEREPKKTEGKWRKHRKCKKETKKNNEKIKK
jgi:hypothetical protein